jgi:murein L,D-transpeptidase YcbB/YkuD
LGPQLTADERAALFLQRYQDKTSKVIADSYLQVNNILDHLNKMTDMIVMEHETSYIMAYKEHMVKVQMELIDMKRKTTETYYRMKAEDRTKFLEGSIAWLRKEVMKLMRALERAQVQNKDMRKELEEARKEKAFMMEYTVCTKKENLRLKKTVEQLKDPDNIMRYAKNIVQNEEAEDTVADELPEKASMIIKSTSEAGFNFMKSPMNMNADLVFHPPTFSPVTELNPTTKHATRSNETSSMFGGRGNQRISTAQETMRKPSEKDQASTTFSKTLLSFHQRTKSGGGMRPHHMLGN